MRIVFFCIGTPNVVGDSVGPRVGDALKDKGIKAFVYGSSTSPITALNVDKYHALLCDKHSSDLIIAIDSALGDKNDIGTIKLKDGGICPGGAFNKTNFKIGDVGLLAIVGDSAKDRFLELKKANKELLDELVNSVLLIVDNLYSESLSNVLI